MKQVIPFAVVTMRTVLVGLLMGLSATGCAWIDPHPRAQELFEFKYDSSSKTDSTSIKFAGTLDKAIDAANAQRKLYASHAGQLSVIRSLVALGVTGVTAGALYTGITSNRPDVISALGIAGASTLGLSSYFDSRPRQRLYYAASRTIGCAIAAMTPFLIPENVFNSFIADLRGLEAHVASVETSAGRVENATAALRTTNREAREFLEFARRQVAGARLLLERANNIVREGNRLRSSVDRAGPTLHRHTIDIVDKVDEEITKTESDPQTLVALLGGLQTLSQQITRVAPTGGKTQVAAVPSAGFQAFQRDELVEELRLALKNLQTETDNMTLKTTAVSALISQVAAAKEQVEDIRSCQPPEAQTDFAVFPPDDVKDVQAPDTLSFLVTGSVNAPVWALTNRKAADAKGDMRVQGGVHVVEIEIGENAKTVDALLLIQNGNQLGRKVITLRIKEKPKKEIIDVSGVQKPRPPKTKDEVSLSEDKIKLLQRVVGLRDIENEKIKDRVDGKDGNITRDAIRKYKEDWNLGSGDRIEKKFFETIVVRDEEPLPNPGDPNSLQPILGPHNVYEQDRLKQDSKAIKEIQRKLAELGHGAKETGRYDADMRKAIIAFQNSSSEKRRASGILGQLVVVAIRSATATPTPQIEIDPTTLIGPQNVFEKDNFNETDIKDLQGLLTVPKSGKFDTDTRKAIIEFQKKKDLPVTGVLSPEMLQKLKNLRPR